MEYIVKIKIKTRESSIEHFTEQFTEEEETKSFLRSIMVYGYYHENHGENVDGKERNSYYDMHHDNFFKNDSLLLDIYPVNSIEKISVIKV